MIKHYKKLLDQLDLLMISLAKQKQLGLDPEVIKALKDLTRARNEFKREFIKASAPKVIARNESVFTNFLDEVAQNV